MIGKKKIQPFSLNLKRGEILGILGPNGCGKTTLLQTLAGFKPYEGKIFLDEKNIALLSFQDMARKRAILFQEKTWPPFPQSLYEYCLTSRFPHLPYFKKESIEDKKIILAALDAMSLLSMQHKDISTLSGGEKQRLAIGALLAQTPRLYLLDEPTNHLDIKHRIQVLNYFRYLAKQQSCTIIISMHDINLASHYCEYLLLLFPDGKTIQGKTNDILTTHHLNCLYDHPIKAMTIENKIYWSIN